MNFFKVFILVFIAFASLTACKPAAAPVSISNKPVSINDIPQTNLPLPPSKPIEQMSWTKFDGSIQALKDLSGKAVILDFWATYCAPCREEIPHLNALQEKYGRDNLSIIGLHVGGDEDRPKIPAFVEQLKVEYELAYPEDELTRFIFGGETAIPQTAVFDRRGRLVTKIIGFNSEIQTKLDKAVETAINNSANN